LNDTYEKILFTLSEILASLQFGNIDVTILMTNIQKIFTRCSLQ